jgi:hypothetical protein
VGEDGLPKAYKGPPGEAGTLVCVGSAAWHFRHSFRTRGLVVSRRRKRVVSPSRADRNVEVARAKPTRYAYADSLRVLLVAGVIVGHVTMSWSGIHAGVLEEPPVQEPLLTVIKLAALVGTMFAMALFFLIAGAFTPRSLSRKGLRSS